MGTLGAQEMIFIFVLALLLFGPKKLPELGRMLGKAVREFQKAKNELRTTFETHMNELDREARASTNTSSTPDYTSPRYPYPYDDYGRYDSEYSSTTDAYNEAAHTGSIPEPAPASTVSSENAEPYRDQESHPVEGTVARSNGVRPVEPVPVSTDEAHHSS